MCAEVKQAGELFAAFQYAHLSVLRLTPAIVVINGMKS